MVRFRFLSLIFASWGTACHGFVVTLHGTKSFGRCLAILDSLKKNSDEKPVVEAKPALALGTLVEFEEKGRCHVGKIDGVEPKSNGNARYDVADHEGKHYNIPDKAVHFSIPSPTNPPAADKLFDEVCVAQQASEDALRKRLEVSPDLLEIVWEETSLEDDSESASHELTPGRFVEILHSHAASQIEKYMAWRLLQTDLAHVFFKELKHHGKVVSFKARAHKAVEAAKKNFCATHPEEDEFCFV